MNQMSKMRRTKEPEPKGFRLSIIFLMFSFIGNPNHQIEEGPW